MTPFLAESFEKQECRPKPVEVTEFHAKREMVYTVKIFDCVTTERSYVQEEKTWQKAHTKHDEGTQNASFSARQA